jgi:nucleoside-diphosphate-sugar epimerase
VERLAERLPGLKVLVTGGDGFIGSHLVKRLSDGGARVHVLCRPAASRPNHPAPGAEGEGIYRADLLDQEGLARIVDQVRPRVVFHLAGLVNLERSFDIAEGCIRSNVQGTLSLLQALRKTDLDALVFTSTSEVYGNNPAPFTEEQREDPPSPYAISKLAAEHLCGLFRKTRGTPVTIARLSTVYGPRQAEGKLIPYVVKSFLAKKEVHITKGIQKRDFVYVEDAVDGLIRASLVKEAIGEVINVGHPEALAVREVVSKIGRLCGVKEGAVYSDLPLRPNEQLLCACLGEKAKRILGWEPRTTLDQGLSRTVAWYAANGSPRV